MIVKTPQPIEAPRPAISRAEVREALIELWAQIFEAEFRAHRAEDATDDRHHDAVPRAAQQGDP